MTQKPKNYIDRCTLSRKSWEMDTVLICHKFHKAMSERHILRATSGVGLSFGLLNVGVDVDAKVGSV
jgi:hypothetical protein